MITSNDPTAAAAGATPFVPEVVSPPDPLLELNTLKAKLAAQEKKFTTLTAERDELKAALETIEKNPLMMVIANLDAGQVLTDCGEKFGDLCTTVRRRDEKGAFSIKIVVKPFKGDAFVFIPEVKVTEPKEEIAQGVFYIDGDGVISRNDPRQREFGFSGRRGGEED